MTHVRIAGAVLLALVATAPPARAQSNPELADQIDEMFEKAQKLRKPLFTNPRDKTALRMALAQDKRNTDALKGILDKHGWPGQQLVGNEASHNAFQMVLMADLDRPFQRRCLKLMEEAARNSDFTWQDVAYLTDRLLIADGKPQRYGTHFKEENGDYVPYPLEDPKNVDQRRQSIGLPPLAEYKKTVEESMKRARMRQ